MDLSLETAAADLYATRWQTGPEPVTRYAPNSFGLYDICENVHEWCSDWYDEHSYEQSPEIDPPRAGLRKSAGIARRLVV